MKIRRGKARVRTIISCIIALICAVGVVYSGAQIIAWKIDSDKTIAQTEEINQAVTIEEVDDSDDVEIIAEDEPKEPDTPYWHYIKMSLIDVDFTELRKINSDVGGWVQVKGTNINYPFAKAGDNEFYLKHSFNKSYNTAGWVWADYRNHVDGTDKNMILYAHGRNDGTMFGTLKNILTSGWLDNPDNYVVRTSNDYEDALWQVFSIYHVQVTNDYIKTLFSSDSEFDDFVKMITERSAYDFHTSVNTNDRLLTLSTCYAQSERVVLHAKLIKRLTKN